MHKPFNQKTLLKAGFFCAITLVSSQCFAASTYPEYEDQDTRALMEERLILSPEEIRQGKADISKYKANMQKRAIPRNFKSVIIVDPDNYDSAPVVNVVANFPSSISFFDITGEPWEVSEFMSGDKRVVNVVQSSKSSNLLWVTPQTIGGSTSVTLLLEGMRKTFTIMIQASTKVMNRDTVIRVSAMSNAAKKATFQKRVEEPKRGDELFLLKFFSGAIPLNKELIRELNVGSMGVRVWIARKVKTDAWNMVIKTRHRLLTPYQFSVMNEVYLIENPKPFLRLIVAGQSARLSTGI